MHGRKVLPRLTMRWDYCS